MQEQELLDLKEEINKAKTEVAELTGKKKQLIKTLKEEWDCDTLKAAQSTLMKSEKSITDLNEQIKTGTEELEERMNSPKRNIDFDIMMENK